MFDKKPPFNRLYEKVINQKKFEIIDYLYATDCVNRIATFGLESDIEVIKKIL